MKGANGGVSEGRGHEMEIEPNMQDIPCAVPINVDHGLQTDDHAAVEHPGIEVEVCGGDALVRGAG